VTALDDGHPSLAFYLHPSLAFHVGHMHVCLHTAFVFSAPVLTPLMRQKRLRRSASTVIGRWKHRALSRAYERWRDRVDVPGFVQRILRGFMGRWLQCALVRAFTTWRIHADMAVFFVWEERVLRKVEAVQKDALARELGRSREHKRAGGRSMSEPRLNRSEKEFLMDRILESSQQLAESRCVIAEAKLEAAVLHYEDMTKRYIQERDQKTILELGPSGHLLDHRYTTSEPKFESAFARAIQGLGQVARADNEAVLRRRLEELEAYCRCIEQDHERMACQVALRCVYRLSLHFPQPACRAHAATNPPQTAQRTDRERHLALISTSTSKH
jgi:hypothetical protein